MFQVGDKVVRKPEWVNRNEWKYGSGVLTVERINEIDIWFKETPLSWATSYFDLYVEPVVAPAPKFKVGDTLCIEGNAAFPPNVVTNIKYVYEFGNPIMAVHEAKLSLYVGPPKPREVTVDGVVYREVL